MEKRLEFTLLTDFYWTVLLGRLAPIFTFNCKNILFVYIVKQKQTKFRGIYKNFIIHKPSLGSREASQMSMHSCLEK